jgi:hypothetical protein
MDLARRSILKMFGVTAAVAVTPTPTIAIPEPARDPLTLQLSPPAGMTYNWKRLFITQSDPDMENILKMVATGWKPVPLARHREHFAPNAHPFSNYWIEVGGLVLMEKPSAEITPPIAYPTPWKTS